MSYRIEFKQANDYCKTDTATPGIPLLAWTNRLSPGRTLLPARTRPSFTRHLMTSNLFARVICVHWMH